MKTRKKTPRKTQKPSTSKPLRKPPYSLKQERQNRYRALHFPEVVGKKTARVELVTSSEYHAVVVVFEDNTAVGFEFHPGFTVQAFGEASTASDRKHPGLGPRSGTRGRPSTAERGRQLSREFTRINTKAKSASKEKT